MSLRLIDVIIYMSPSVISSSSGHKFTKPKKAEIKPSKELEIFAERRKRVTAAFAKIHLEYDPLDYPTKYQLAQERVNLHLQQEYDDECISRKLLGITRVKLPVPNLFEDTEGNLDNSVKSALVYRVQIDIKREDAVKAGAHNDLIHSCLFTIGRYEAPLPRYTFGSKGEIINSRVVGQTRRYFVADTKKNIEAILERFGQPWKLHPWTVAVASHSGSVYYHISEVITIGDYDEWLTNDIQTLIDYSKSGIMELGKKGRIESFKRFRRIQDEKLNKGILITAKDFVKSESSGNNITNKEK